MARGVSDPSDSRPALRGRDPRHHCMGHLNPANTRTNPAVFRQRNKIVGLRAHRNLYKSCPVVPTLDASALAKEFSVFYSQPLATRFGNSLISCITSGKWKRLDIAVAWIRASGIMHLEPALTSFLKAGNELSVVVGV